MKVITVIRDNMMAAKEIMKCIKLKDKTYFLDKYLYPAMEDGYVEQLYPDNPKHPKQKYLLTEWRKRSIPTHSGWLYPLTFDAGKGLKEA